MLVSPDLLDPPFPNPAIPAVLLKLILDEPLTREERQTLGIEVRRGWSLVAQRRAPPG
jgi:hypothetical protein